MKNYVLFLTIFVLASCTSIDTGSIDFRRAETESLKTVQAKFTDIQDNCQPKKKGKICAPMVPTRLDRKQVGKAAKAINKEDVYSIRLDYGVIADLNEHRKLRLRKGNRFGQNGEVVILVKAFEFSESDQNPEGFLNFSQATKDGEDVKDDFSQARVVYFNPDVDAGQQLNINNIPIFGPVKYEGRPVGLQLIILELDKVSEPVMSVMQNLADLGRSHFNAGPVTDALFDLGTSLVEGSQDDIIFEYRMVMDNVKHTKNQIVSPFEEGRIVFRRTQKRKNDFIWRNIRLDENTGALYTIEEKNVSGKKIEVYSPFKDETYMTVNFINHGKDGPEAFFEMEKFEDLEKKLDTYINEKDKPIKNLETPLLDLIGQRQSINKSIELSEMISSMGTAWMSYSYYKLPDNFDKKENCKKYSEINNDHAQRNLKLTDARRVTGQFHDTLTALEEGLLKSPEQTKLLARLSELLLGRLSGNGVPAEYEANNFVAWQNFWTDKYEKINGKEDLIALFEEAAALAAPKTCNELNAIH